MNVRAGTKDLILLVDDDARTARRLAQMLREDGFDVEVAADGAAAISRLARQPVPDVLVTDLRMPHADGTAVSRYARSRRPNLPVFLVTGYPDLVDAFDVPLDPAPIVLTKPLVYAELSAELSRVAKNPPIPIPHTGGSSNVIGTGHGTSDGGSISHGYGVSSRQRSTNHKLRSKRAKP